MKPKIPSRHLHIYNRKSYEEVSENVEIPANFYQKLRAHMETSYMVVPYDVVDGTIDSAHTFFREYYKNRYSHQVSIPDDSVDLLLGYLIQSFEQFTPEIENKFKGSFSDAMNWLTKWRDVSIDMMKNAYELFPIYVTEQEKTLSNYILLKQSVKLIYQTYFQYIDQMLHRTHPEVYDIITFNYWGQELFAFQDKAKELACPSEEDMQRTDNLHNRDLFAHKYSEYIERVLCSSKETDAVCSELKKEFGDLFRDFIERVNAKASFNPEILKFATEYWKDIAITIISNELYFKIALLQQERPKKKFSLLTRVSGISRKILRLEDMFAITDRLLVSICNLYKDHHLSKYLSDPWSQELRDLNLPYRKLFYAMAGEYFSGIKYEQFKYCFESADMSLLQSKCSSKEGAYGAIRYLIIRVGKKCPTWFKEVAKSLTNANGDAYTHLTLARSVKDDKEFAKAFRKLMAVNDIVLPK